MNVSTFDGKTEEPLSTNVPLEDVMGDDTDELAQARNELERVGRYWTGGGAAPLVLIMRVRT